MTAFYFGIFSFSVLLSLVLTRYVRNLAVGKGWLSPPSTERHLHSTPLPRLGGIAIFLAFLLSVALAVSIGCLYPSVTNGFSWGTAATILFSGSLVFLLGVYDDLRGTGPYFKFAVQAVAGAVLYAGGLRVLDLPVLFGNRSFAWYISFPLTILWVIGITNAFNLIDGLDGLAAGSALFSTLVVFVVALFSQSGFVSLLALALAGAILGFLRFNFNPATIFLGDSGSLFIGFMLSALALAGAQKAPTVIAVAIPVVSFGLPILETALSVLRRMISGRPVFTADREHIHHKLLQRGLSHRQVVIVLYAVSAMFALLSLFLLWPTGSTLGLVLAVLGTGVWMGVQHLNYLEFGEIRRVAQRTMEQRQVFINNLAIRRATEELKASSDFNQICRVLAAAFGGNDFDGFELRLRRKSAAQAPARMLSPVETDYRWTKPGARFSHEMVTAWNLSLDLVAANNRRWGSLTLYRQYGERTLQIDVNLLVSVFPVALADALDRTFAPVEIAVLDAPQAEFFTAQAG